MANHPDLKQMIFRKWLLVNSGKFSTSGALSESTEKHSLVKFAWENGAVVNFKLVLTQENNILSPVCSKMLSRVMANCCNWTARV